jgi:hypothetical protein
MHAFKFIQSHLGQSQKTLWAVQNFCSHIQPQVGNYTKIMIINSLLIFQLYPWAMTFLYNSYVSLLSCLIYNLKQNYNLFNLYNQQNLNGKKISRVNYGGSIWKKSSISYNDGLKFFLTNSIHVGPNGCTPS